MNLTDELIAYSEDCISGKIVACRKHKWAGMRFLRDIDRQNTDEFPYVFDEKKALRFLNWMRLFKHRRGILKGQRIEPHIIQKFVFGNVYGWVHRDTGYRRFRRFYWQVGKKNAKSQSLACVGTYETMALGEGAAEVFCAATKTEQGRIVHDEAAAMLRGCAELQGRFNIAYGRIWHIKTGSFMRVLSKEDGQKGDGINPQCTIVDEYQAHDTAEMYDVADSSDVALPQPLLAIITTAGFDLSKPCYSVEYHLVSKILDPDNPFEDDAYFVMINELDAEDDIMDPSVWPKSNPILCSYPEGVEALARKLKTAIEEPQKMRNFMTKNMNVWIQQKEQGYMDMGKWMACAAKPDDPFPDIKGLDVITGLDLSQGTAFSSVSHEISLPDGRIAVMSKSFLPKETLDTYRSRNNTKIPLWCEQGHIIETPGAVVEYNYILDYLDEVYEANEWRKGEIAFDRALATWLIQQLELRGFIPVNITQGMLTLGSPTKDFRMEVYKANVIHDDPVLSWAIGNAVCDEDKNENVMLNKKKSKEMIDPAAALINAHVRFVVKQEPSAYEDRGILMV